MGTKAKTPTKPKTVKAPTPPKEVKKPLVDGNKEISEYLSDPKRDYFAGVQLFGKYTKNKALLGLFTRKENAYSKEKLEYELGKIGEVAVEQVVNKNEPSKVETPVIPLNPTPPNQDPEQLTQDQEDKLVEYDIRLKNLYVERCKLSNELAAAASLTPPPPQEELKAKVDEIIAKLAEYNSVFLERKALSQKPLGEDHLETDAEKGISLQKDILLVAEVAVLKSQMQPIREKISKLRANLKKSPNSPKLGEWKTELAQNEASLQELDTKKKLLEEGN
jgi:hypothetical protein